MTSRPLIVGITGKARQGKTSFAVSLHEWLTRGGIDTDTWPISTTFKRFWAQTVGISMEDLERQKGEVAHPYSVTHREALERLGDWGRGIDKHFWLDAMLQSSVDSEVMIIPDVRVEDEASWIRDRGGYLIHIHSDTLPTIDSTHTVQSQPLKLHMRDTRIVNNTTLAELDDRARVVAAAIQASIYTP